MPQEVNFNFRSKLYESAEENWGPESQIGMLHEEVGELLQAVNKLKRFGPTDQVKDTLAEEIADVRIMLEQLSYMFKLSPEITRWETEKLKRLGDMLGIEMKDE